MLIAESRRHSQGAIGLATEGALFRNVRCGTTQLTPAWLRCSRLSNYDSLGAVRDAERLENGLHVDLHRALGETEFISDLLVRFASAQGREHVVLPWA